jgi:hypothetical protein
LIVTGYGLFHEQISPNPHSYEAPKRAAALTSGSTLSANLAQLARPTGPATGSPTPAQSSEPVGKAAATVPVRIDEEGKSVWPDYLRERVESESGPSGIKEFHALMSREVRDPDWAAATEYGVQDSLRALAPDLIARMQFFQISCASTMCEMAAVLDHTDPAQASKDVDLWQQRLYQAAAQDGWKATGLGPPEALLVFIDPTGRPTFIAQFEKG